MHLRRAHSRHLLLDRLDVSPHEITQLVRGDPELVLHPERRVLQLSHLELPCLAVEAGLAEAVTEAVAVLLLHETRDRPGQRQVDGLVSFAVEPECDFDPPGCRLPQRKQRVVEPTPEEGRIEEEEREQPERKLHRRQLLVRNEGEERGAVRSLYGAAAGEDRGDE